MNNITRDDIAEFINREFGLAKKDGIDLVNDIIDEIDVYDSGTDDTEYDVIVNDTIENNIRYGEKFSSDWDAFPNKTIIGNDIGDYKLNLNSCKKFANTKDLDGSIESKRTC